MTFERPVASFSYGAMRRKHDILALCYTAFRLRNKLFLWSVHGIMNTSGLVQSNKTKHKLITYIYIYFQSSINFLFSPISNLAGSPDILN